MHAALPQCGKYAHRAVEADDCTGRTKAAGPIIVDLDGGSPFLKSLMSIEKKRHG